jgi:hypothetical protein
MRSTLLRWGTLPLAVVAAAVIAVGFRATSAEAQVPVSPVVVGGP